MISTSRSEHYPVAVAVARVAVRLPTIILPLPSPCVGVFWNRLLLIITKYYGTFRCYCRNPILLCTYNAMRTAAAVGFDRRGGRVKTIL